MKKRIINGIIIVITLFACITGIKAATILANSVTYGDMTVQDALDELIEQAHTLIDELKVQVNSNTTNIDSLTSVVNDNKTEIESLKSNSTGNLSMRYNEERDIAQVYYNGEWIDWISVGVQPIDFVTTTADDWINNHDGAYTFTKTEEYIQFLFSSAYSNGYFQYSNPVSIQNGRVLKLTGKFLGNYSAGSSANTTKLQIKVDDTVIYEKNATANGSWVTISETIDLSNYAGLSGELVISITTAVSGYSPQLQLTKFLIE